MTIITISRQVGSLGDKIAEAVAEQFGYEHIEKSKISSVLSDQGFSASYFEKYDEKKPFVWQSLSIQNKKFSHLIRAAVYELAAKENVVIVGRGGQVIFKNFTGALHIRVIAPYAARVNRLMEQKGCDKKDAEQIIRQTDRDSSGFINAYFDADWEDKDLYDLIINTRTTSLNTGVAMITCALDADEFKKSPEHLEKLRDLSLVEKVKAKLLDIPGMEISHLGAENGVVSISGLANSSEEIEACEKVISNIRGVTQIDNQLTVVTARHGYL